MKKTSPYLTLAIAVLSVTTAYSQEISELTLPAGGNGVSQRAEVSQWIGLVKISIDYHSPAVHRGPADRTGHIWGELVPYGLFDDGHGPSKQTPWRAGANESTTITLSHGVKVEGRDLPAGTYAVYIITARDAPWTWIFSKHTVGWGSYQYDPSEDVLRVQVQPEAAPSTEYLTYGFDGRRRDAATAYLQWENKRIPLHITVPNVNELYIAQMRKELQGWPGFRAENWATAAHFCAITKLNLEEALVWADKAISDPFRGATVGVEDFFTLQTKAEVLEAMGRGAEAEPIVKKALALPGTRAELLHFYAIRVLSRGDKQRAMEVFQLNAQRHPDEPYWTHLGLARGYTALGDKPNAVQQWELAIRNTPESEKDGVAEFTKILNGLKSGR